MEIFEEPCTGEFSYFEIVRGSPEHELAEQFDSAIVIFSRVEKKQDIAFDYGMETIHLQQGTLSLQKDTRSLLHEGISLQKETFGEVKGILQELDKILNPEIY